MKTYRIVSAQESRRLDMAAIDLGLPGAVLMENAANACVCEILKENPSSVLVFCGKGSNGGDGFAIARKLFLQKIDVTVITLADSFSGDAKMNFDVLKRLGVPILSFDKNQIYKADVIVDAILGTGINGDVCGIYKDAIECINSLSSFVLAVDIPSGINADTGRVCSVAVKADKTVTFAFPKLGIYSPLSADFVGERVVADISVPDIFGSLKRFLTGEEILKEAFPKKSIASHKGDMGRVSVIGGSAGMAGAPYMTSSAALRTGAGLVTCVVPEEIMPAMMEKLTGAMCSTSLPEKSDSIAIGCGMGNTEKTFETVKNILETYSGNLIIDADALNAISKKTDILKNTKARVIITPHIGEMAKLTGLSPEYITENRVCVAEDFSKEYNVITVLKGAYTVIASKKSETYINPIGCPCLAKGGSGDILLGIIAALSARCDALLAARAGVYLHSLTGVACAEKYGEYCANPDDIIDCIKDIF